jgi:hypothetical protein
MSSSVFIASDETGALRSDAHTAAAKEDSTNSLLKKKEKKGKKRKKKKEQILRGRLEVWRSSSELGRMPTGGATD